MSYTPGPWYRRNRIDALGHPCGVDIAGNGKCIARMPDGATVEPVDWANGVLIAAAPALLNHLAGVLGHYWDSQAQCCDEAREFLNALRDEMYSRDNDKMQRAIDLVSDLAEYLEEAHDEGHDPTLTRATCSWCAAIDDARRFVRKASTQDERSTQ